jgi:hypothetical protein
MAEDERPTLSDVLGALVSSVARARRIADNEVMTIARMYKRHEHLRGLSVPRLRLRSVTLELPVLLREVVRPSVTVMATTSTVVDAIGEEMSRVVAELIKLEEQLADAGRGNADVQRVLQEYAEEIIQRAQAGLLPLLNTLWIDFGVDKDGHVHEAQIALVDQIGDTVENFIRELVKSMFVELTIATRAQEEYRGGYPAAEGFQASPGRPPGPPMMGFEAAPEASASETPEPESPATESEPEPPPVSMLRLFGRNLMRKLEPSGLESSGLESSGPEAVPMAELVPAATGYSTERLEEAWKKAEASISPESRAELLRTFLSRPTVQRMVQAGRDAAERAAISEPGRPGDFVVGVDTEQIKAAGTPEAVTRVRMTLSEEGLEWSTEDGGDGQQRWRLGPE